MNVKVYNQTGKEVATGELPDAVFGLPWNADLVHQVITSQMANQRQVTAHTKGRSEVRGGGRKPWRQKGTGRARHGSIRSPLWKGGGVTHGPTKEKIFKKKINKKMASRALATALSAKARDKEILVTDDIALERPKTKDAVVILKNLSAISGFAGVRSKSALVLSARHDPALLRAFRNVQSVTIEEARNVTALDVMNHIYIILPKSAVEVLAGRLSK